MKPLEQFRVIAILAREEAIHTYARAHDRHHALELAYRARGDWDGAEQEHEAARIALLAYERESFNPLPRGLE